MSLLAPTAVTDDARAAWAELEARAIEPNAFLSPHFVLPALRHLDAGTRATIALVWDDAGPTSTLRGAGVFTEARPSVACPLPHLVAYRSCHSYLSGLLIDRDDAAPTVEALLDALARSARCHGVVFENLRSDGPLCTLLRAAAASRSGPMQEIGHRSRAILRPGEAGPGYLAERLGSRLTDSDRLLRRLRKQAPVRWAVHRGGASLDRSVERHLELEHQGWKGAVSSALASQPAHEAFFREMVAGFAGEERALFTELSVGDEIIAVSSNFVSGDAAFAFKIGWALAYGRFSPGVLNEVELIRNAPEVCRGLAYVDSGAEPGSFIERLWLDRYLLVDVVVPLTRAGRWSLATASLARRLSRRAKGVELLDEGPTAVDGARRSAPHAIVLSCEGAPEGALNVVRSLGPAGIPITLLTEDADDLVGASRYVTRVVHVPRFTQDPTTFLEAIDGIVRHGTVKPILFPTADPDLLLASRHAAALRSRCRVLAAPPELLETLIDKRRFASLAERLRLNVPRTFVPSSASDLAAIAAAVRYPAIVKPAHPLAWNHEAVRAVVGSVKAIQLETQAELLSCARRIAAHDLDFLIQELVPGPDENHVDLHAFLDSRSRPVAWFTGQKLRIHPPHAGSGCYVKSVTVPEVIEAGLEALRRCELTGLANVNFKRHAVTGEYVMLEINPRVSQWNILAARAGVNLPLLAYQRACGAPTAPRRPQTDGLTYVNLRKDLSAFRVYRREQSLSIPAYLRSLVRPKLVPQVFDHRDLGPWLRAGGRALRNLTQP